LISAATTGIVCAIKDFAKSCQILSRVVTVVYMRLRLVNDMHEVNNQGIVWAVPRPHKVPPISLCGSGSLGVPYFLTDRSVSKSVSISCNGDTVTDKIADTILNGATSTVTRSGATTMIRNVAASSSPSDWARAGYNAIGSNTCTPATTSVIPLLNVAFLEAYACVGSLWHHFVGYKYFETCINTIVKTKGRATLTGHLTDHRTNRWMSLTSSGPNNMTAYCFFEDKVDGSHVSSLPTLSADIRVPTDIGQNSAFFARCGERAHNCGCFPCMFVAFFKCAGRKG
jgi:hypothetical protein